MKNNKTNKMASIINNLKRLMKNKKGIEVREIGLWVLFLIALTLIMLGMFLMKERGVGLIDYLKEMLRFGK